MLFTYSAGGASSPAQGRIAYARASRLVSLSKSVTQCLTRAAGGKVIGRETTRGQEGR